MGLGLSAADQVGKCWDTDQCMGFGLLVGFVDNEEKEERLKPHAYYTAIKVVAPSGSFI